jgi:tripartite-type tricarboxylate transporter receptor subunit TctC
MATSVGLYRKLSFNPLEDFEYVGQIADAHDPARQEDAAGGNLTELIATCGPTATRSPWPMRSGRGVASVRHALPEGDRPDLVTVPYKGTRAMTDLLGGQVDVLCDQTTQTLQHIAAGNVKLTA